jgi:hypothetical protein
MSNANEQAFPGATEPQKANQRANAHLIAAAPDMYELLSDIIAPPAYAMNSMDRLEAIRDAARDVLAKARGEA